MTDLDVQWIADPAGLLPLHAEWAALAEHLNADIFMRPDWIEIWWRHFGQRSRLACLAARQEGVLVGVLPFRVETLWVGPLPIRIARLAGTDPNTLVLQVPVAPDHLDSLLQAAFRHLTRNLGAVAVSFSPLSAEASHGPALRRIAGPDCPVVEQAAGVHVMFDLPASFEDYLAGLSKKRQGEFRRMVRNLTQAMDMVGDSYAPTPAEFQHFIDLHGEQWHAVGKGGHFSDWPGTAGFYKDICANPDSRQMVAMDRLKGTPGDIAIEFSLVAGKTSHWRLPARKLDAEVDRLGAGKVVFLLMFKRMIEQGFTRVEAGRGIYPYKIDYGGRYADVWRMILLRPGRLAALRLRLLLAWSDLLNLAYYRIWFLKLAPRLHARTGLKSRPLWRSWIRTRL